MKLNLRLSPAATCLALWLLLLFTAWLYWPGLYGGYILDDWPNLESLNSVKHGNNLLEDSGKVAVSGHGGSYKRGVSMLSFAVQASSWPIYPFDFKYVNLMLHLLNGSLVFWLVLLLGRRMSLEDGRNHVLALLAAGVWLLHPLQVSTVLYVVQRMTELAALFTLLGLVSYLYGRQALAEGRLWRAYALLAGGFGLALVLATFSKENGILLVLYTLALELTLLRGLPGGPYLRQWRWVFLYTPLLLLLGYFVSNPAAHIFSAYDMRNFNLGERLLTETRILWDYVGQILLPRPHLLGLFHDEYIPSRSLLNPATTLLALLGLLGSVIVAVVWRKRYPLLAFAVLWFLAGHALESSFVGLVLYFEHRNYLALLGPIYAVLYGLLHWLPQLNRQRRTVPLAGWGLALVWLLIFPLLTRGEAVLWGDPVQQSYLWADQNPNSKYAQSHAAATFRYLSKYDKATEYYQHMVTAFPETSAPYLLWVEMACDQPSFMPDLDKVYNNLQTATSPDLGLLNGVISLRDKHSEGKCPALSVAQVQRIFDLLMENPHNQQQRDFLQYQYAVWHASEKRYAQALALIAPLLARQENLGIRKEQVIWLVMSGRFDEAEAALQQARQRANATDLFLERQFFEQTAQLIPELRQMLHVPAPEAQP